LIAEIHPIFWIYSIALAKLTAQIIFGVHASNFIRFDGKEYQSVLTSSMAHHHEIVDERVLIRFLFKYIAQIQV